MRVKTGGRKANTPNRINAEAKQVIQEVVNSEINKIPQLLEQLKPKDRLEILIKLIAFVIPKQTKIEVETEISERFTPIIINLSDEDESKSKTIRAREQIATNFLHVNR